MPTVLDNFGPGWKSREMYSTLSNQLLRLDKRLVTVPMRRYVGFKIGQKVAFTIVPRESKLVLELYRVEPSDLVDPANQVTYKPNSKEDFNKHVSRFNVTTAKDVDYSLKLASQVLEKYFRP